MSKINYKKAREILTQSCERYIVHNKSQLDALQSRKQNGLDGFLFKPDSGFGMWALYVYKNMKKYISFLDKTGDLVSDEEWLSDKDYFKKYSFGKLKLNGTDVIGGTGGMGVNHSNPSVVLHNLTALTKYLNYITADLNRAHNDNVGYSLALKTDDSPLEKNKIYMEFISNTSIQYTVMDPVGKIQTGLISNDDLRESELTGLQDLKCLTLLTNLLNLDQLNLFLPKILEITSERRHIQPISVQIYKLLDELESIKNLIASSPIYDSGGYVSALYHQLDSEIPIFEGYIKGTAVQELKAILDDATLSDENSVKAMAAQLENETILEILEKNRQSQTEHILKVLSVALVAVGIGVIPTMFLAAKRLYDTGGSSINFFKPLSQNLYDDAMDVTSNIENAP